jgi:hypothetical protein
MNAQEWWTYVESLRNKQRLPREVILEHIVVEAGVEVGNVKQRLDTDRKLWAAVWIRPDIASEHSIVFSPYLEEMIGIKFSEEVIRNLFGLVTWDLYRIEHFAINQPNGHGQVDHVQGLWSVRLLLNQPIELEIIQVILGRIYAFLTMDLKPKAGERRVLKHLVDSRSPFVCGYAEAVLTNPYVSGFLLSVPVSTIQSHTVYLPQDMSSKYGIGRLESAAGQLASEEVSLVKDWNICVGIGGYAEYELYRHVSIEVVLSVRNGSVIWERLFDRFVKILES